MLVIVLNQINLCGCGGTGRRAALRSLWMNNPWRFKSSQPHHTSHVTNLIVSILYSTGDWCEINCKRLCALLMSS